MTGLVSGGYHDRASPELVASRHGILIAVRRSDVWAGRSPPQADSNSVAPYVVTWLVATAWIPPLIRSALQKSTRAPAALLWAAGVPTRDVSRPRTPRPSKLELRWLTGFQWLFWIASRVGPIVATIVYNRSWRSRTCGAELKGVKAVDRDGVLAPPGATDPADRGELGQLLGRLASARNLTTVPRRRGRPRQPSTVEGRTAPAGTATASRSPGGRRRDGQRHSQPASSR